MALRSPTYDHALNPAREYLRPRFPNHRLVKLVGVEVLGKEAGGCFYLHRYRQGVPTFEASPATRTLRNVLCLHTPSALDRLVSYLLAFFERLEATAGYARVVHEEVFASIIRCNKAVALLAVKPFNRSLGHVLKLIFLSLGSSQQKGRPSSCRAALHSCCKPQLPLRLHYSKIRAKAPTLRTPAFLFKSSISKQTSPLGSSVNKANPSLMVQEPVGTSV